jgi:hypothetical protein
VTLYHAAPVVRALAIMLRGFHDRRDGARSPYGQGIAFRPERRRANEAPGVLLEVDDLEPLRRYAVSLWPHRRTAGHRNYFYVLPADVANCYAPRMVGAVAAVTRTSDVYE